LFEQGWSLTNAAEAAEVSDRTCAKWVHRYRAQGEAGLRDPFLGAAWHPASRAARRPSARRGHRAVAHAADDR
jgi:transposase